MALAETVKKYLESGGFQYQLVRHPQSSSTRESADAAAVPVDHIAKGVVLKDSKGFVTAAIPGSNWLKLHKLQDELDRPLELAAERDVERLFGDCQPGAVPCLGIAYGLETVVDEELDSLAFIYFEAGDHETLVRVTGEDFGRLLRGMRRGFYSACKVQ